MNGLAEWIVRKCSKWKRSGACGVGLDNRVVSSV